MPAGDEALDDVRRVGRCDHAIRPAAARDNVPPPRRRLDRPGRRRTDRDHAAPVVPRQVDHPRARGRQFEPLRTRCLAGLLRGDAGVQGDWCELHARRHQTGHQCVGERSPGRGHLGAAGVPTEDGLVGRERVAPVEVAVGDRSAVPRELAVQVAAHRRTPKTVAGPGRGRRRPARPRRPQHQAYVTEHHDVPGRRIEQGPSRVGCRAQLDDTVAGVELVRDMQHDRRAGELGVDLGGHGGGRVDHQHVAGVQVLGQVAELSVGQPVGRRDQQAHLVAFEATFLGRLRREGRCGEAGVRGLVEERHPKASAR